MITSCSNKYLTYQPNLFCKEQTSYLWTRGALRYTGYVKTHYFGHLIEEHISTILKYSILSFISKEIGGQQGLRQT